MPDEGPSWPVEMRGVTESVVATRGPNGRWNLAALGLHPPADGLVRARTYGRTRTRRNFERTGEGVVQFVRDPVVFVEAALSILEADDPVHEAADAWVRASVEVVERREADGTEIVEWAMNPVSATTERTSVPTINRGFNAVVEGTVWASRLDVPEYDDGELVDRLAFLSDVVDAAGTDRDRRAFDRIDDLTGWRDRC